MKVIINPAYSILTDFINNMPQDFDKNGEEIYKARNVIKRYIVDKDDFLVKSFKEPILVNRIAYTFFRRSKARRSYDYSFELLRHGILTPDPIAYIESKSYGLLKNSYFFSRNITNAKTLREYSYGKDNTPGLTHALAEYLLKLHDEGVHHIDLSPGNILYETDANGNHSFFLVDINRMTFNRHFDMDARARNFDRLVLDKKTSSELATEYSLLSGYPGKEFTELVNKYTDKFYYKRTIKMSVRNYKNGKSNFIDNPLTKHSLLYLASFLIPKGTGMGKKIFNKRKDLYLKYFKDEDPRGYMARKFGYDK